MMWVLLTIALSISSQVVIVEGFGSGAPAPRCGDMLPSHGPQGQTTPIPYTLTSPSSTYSPGGQVTLTLGGGNFAGYLIIAKNAANQYIGSMNVPAAGGGQTVACSGIGNTGLTHSSNVIKSTVSFQWDAPATDSGDITFFVTVVQSYSVYWVGQSLLTLSADIGAPVTTSIPLPQTSFVSPQLTTEVISLTTTQLTTQNMIPLKDDVNHTPTNGNSYNEGSKWPFANKITTGTNIKPLGTTNTQTSSSIKTLRNGPNATIPTQLSFSSTKGSYKTIDSSTTIPKTDNSYNENSKWHSTRKLTTTSSIRQLSTTRNQAPSTVLSKTNAPILQTGLSSTLATYTTPPSPTTVHAGFHTDPPMYYTNHYPAHATFDRLQNMYPKTLIYDKHNIDLSSRYDPSTTDKYSPTYSPLGFMTGKGSLQYDYPSPTDTNSPHHYDYNNYMGSESRNLKAQDTYVNNDNSPLTHTSNGDVYPELPWNTYKINTKRPSKLNYPDPDTTTNTKESSTTTTEMITIQSTAYENTISTKDALTTSQHTSARDVIATETVTQESERSTIAITSTSGKDNSTITSAFSSTPAYVYQSTSTKKSNQGTFSEGSTENIVPSFQTTNKTDISLNSTEQPKNTNPSRDKIDVPKPVVTTESSGISIDQSDVFSEISSTDITNQVSSEAECTSGSIAPSDKKSKDSNESDVFEETPITNIRVEKELRIRPWGVSHVISHGHNLVKASSPKASVQTTTTKEVKRTTPPQDNTPRKLSVQGGNILYDDDCGSSKGCFVKCSDQQCEFMVTWRDVGSGVQFEIYGRPGFPNAWVAVGFSDDTKMGGDSVVECVSNNGMVQVFNSENTGYSNRRMNPAQMGLSNMYGTYSNGILYCTFVRQKFMPSMPSMHDLESDWNIMFALGETFNIPAWTIRMHDTSVLPPVSASRVDFQSFDVIGSGVTYKLVKAHGCLMILAWVLFTGIGVVVARYYKNVWADKTFLKLKIWFQIHRTCMVLAVVLNVLAFIIIFIDVEGYSEINVPGKSYLKAHPVLGIIVTGLCLANPIMAIFRPGPDSNKRPVFNWAHWGVGMTAYVLSAICICFGFQLGKASTPDYAIYIMIVYILHIIAFDVVFEVLDCMLKRQKKAKVDNVEMSTQNGTDTPIPNGHYQTKQSRRSEGRLKTALLLLHIAFTGAFALVLVLVVALN